MRLLVSGASATVRRLAPRWPDHLGHLLTPGNRNSVASILATGLPWAVDNAAFKHFDADAFRACCRRSAGHPRLLWVCCPDKVGDARETLRLFGEWEPELRALGLPLAFVGQDGQEALPVPWDRIACLFIGGSTRWKLSRAAGGLAAEARRRGLLVHMGRANSYRRFQAALDAGCHSVDGTSASMFGDTWIPRYLGWLAHLDRQPTLWE